MRHEAPFNWTPPNGIRRTPHRKRGATGGRGPRVVWRCRMPISSSASGNGVTDWRGFIELGRALGATLGRQPRGLRRGPMSRDRQVGASGTVVTARCYLAFGIAGAPQHLQGITEVQHVVAINTDLHAEMIKRAGPAIIADAQAVMPALIVHAQPASAAGEVQSDVTDLPSSAGALSEKPPHPARLRLAALSREGRGHSLPVESPGLASAGVSPLPSRERADAEGGRVRGFFHSRQKRGAARSTEGNRWSRPRRREGREGRGAAVGWAASGIGAGAPGPARCAGA